jgi:hypothetical protein
MTVRPLSIAFVVLLSSLSGRSRKGIVRIDRAVSGNRARYDNYQK